MITFFKYVLIFILSTGLSGCIVRVSDKNSNNENASNITLVYRHFGLSVYVIEIDGEEYILTDSANNSCIIPKVNSKKDN